MQALILAGGEGTRLRPLTTKVPKPVVPLANRPFISYMLDWLERPRVRRHRDVVRLPCRGRARGARLGRPRRHHASATSRRPSRSAPPAPVKLAEPMLDERFAVLNGDILTDIDLSAVVRFHEERGARADAHADAGRGPVGLRRDPHRRRRAVEAFIEKPQGEAPEQPHQRRHLRAGARGRSTAIPEGRAVSFEREVFPSLVGAGLYGIERGGYWLDIGTPDRYLQATRDILAGVVDTAVGPGFGPGDAGRPAALVFDPLLTGSSCRIEAEAEVGPDVTLGDRCTVGAGAIVRDSALHDGVSIGEGAAVVGSIVGAETTVAPASASSPTILA